MSHHALERLDWVLAGPFGSLNREELSCSLTRRCLRRVEERINPNQSDSLISYHRLEGILSENPISSSQRSKCNDPLYIQLISKHCDSQIKISTSKEVSHEDRAHYLKTCPCNFLNHFNESASPYGKSPPNCKNNLELLIHLMMSESYPTTDYRESKLNAERAMSLAAHLEQPDFWIWPVFPKNKIFGYQWEEFLAYFGDEHYAMRRSENKLNNKT